MKRTNASMHPKFAALLVGAALLGLVSQSALALGTASGTVVDNLAKLSYSVGGTAQNEICSSTTGNTTGNGGTTGTTCVSGTNGATATSFTVDNKTNLTVAEGNTTFTSVVPGQMAAVTAFTVTNNGNTVQDVLLAGANVAATQTLFTLTDNFQMSNVQVFVDSNNNGTYDAGTDTATFIDELAANGSKTVFIVADVPSTQINNDAALVSLTATVAAGGAAGQGAAVTETTVADTAGVDIVFADAAGSDEVARDGKHSARDVYKVVSAVISVQKTSVLLCDPFNGSTNPKNIPGAAVQYAITITNTGTAAATLSQVTDTLNAALAFNTDLINGTGAGANCATGTGSLSASGFGAVSGTGGTTTYTAPGLAAQAVTVGASVSGQLVTINYGTLTSPATGSLVGGVLPAGDFVTVYFNAFVQ